MLADFTGSLLALFFKEGMIGRPHSVRKLRVDGRTASRTLCFFACGKLGSRDDRAMFPRPTAARSALSRAVIDGTSARRRSLSFPFSSWLKPHLDSGAERR